MKKIMFIVISLLMTVNAYSQKYASNGIIYDVKLVIDKTVELDSGEVATFNSGKFAIDADSVAFMVSMLGDSASTSKLTVTGKIEWLTPDINKTNAVWSGYTAYHNKADSVYSQYLYPNAITHTTSQLFANYYIRLTSTNKPTKNIKLKVWMIKYWRKT